MPDQPGLRECPFCGNMGTAFRDGPADYYVGCLGRDCLACSANFDTVAEAAAAWNRRHVPEPLPPLVRPITEEDEL